MLKTEGYSDLTGVKCNDSARASTYLGRTQLVGFHGPKTWTDNEGFERQSDGNSQIH